VPASHRLERTNSDAHPSTVVSAIEEWPSEVKETYQFSNHGLSTISYAQVERCWL
jgi:hypothetical protein